MENPASWTPLHRQLANILAAGNSDTAAAYLVADLLGMELAAVQEIIATHRESLNQGVCGLSLESQLINASMQL